VNQDQDEQKSFYQDILSELKSLDNEVIANRIKKPLIKNLKQLIEEGFDSFNLEDLNSFSHNVNRIGRFLRDKQTNEELIGNLQNIKTDINYAIASRLEKDVTFEDVRSLLENIYENIANSAFFFTGNEDIVKKATTEDRPLLVKYGRLKEYFKENCTDGNVKNNLQGLSKNAISKYVKTLIEGYEYVLNPIQEGQSNDPYKINQRDTFQRKLGEIKQQPQNIAILNVINKYIDGKLDLENPLNKFFKSIADAKSINESQESDNGYMLQMKVKGLKSEGLEEFKDFLQNRFNSGTLSIRGKFVDLPNLDVVYNEEQNGYFIKVSKILEKDIPKFAENVSSYIKNNAPDPNEEAKNQVKNAIDKAISAKYKDHGYNLASFDIGGKNR
jgi:hypothetical protein